MANREPLVADDVERAELIAWLVEEHRGEVYEALYQRAVATSSTIHTDIIEAWKANHLVPMLEKLDAYRMALAIIAGGGDGDPVKFAKSILDGAWKES